MKNYADLGGCYPYNILRDVHNSSHQNRPDSIMLIIHFFLTDKSSHVSTAWRHSGDVVG